MLGPHTVTQTDGPLVQKQRTERGLESPTERGKERLPVAGAAGANGLAHVSDLMRKSAGGNHLLEPVRGGMERVEARLRSVDGSLFGPLSNAFLNLIGSGGKRLRPALALLTAELTRGDAEHGIDERVVALAASVEMLHTSTLVHDDVIDGALLRRGAPTLNATWSGGSTVLAGNYMFGSAAQLAAETGSMRVIHIFSDTLKVIVDGELNQLLDRFHYDQPKENYYQRIYAKTASLFCAAAEGAAVLAGVPEAQVQQLRDFGYNLGMAFQIVDDILDFTGSESTLGKPAGSDLHQGTLTLPFFYYLRDVAERSATIEQLEQVHADAEEGAPELWHAAVERVVAELRQGPAVLAARAEALQFLDNARLSLASFPESVYKRSMLGLCDFVLQRTF